MKEGALTIGVLMVAAILAGGQTQQTAKCDLQIWRAVGEMYAQAVSGPDEFADWLDQNRARYPAGGAWEQCGMRLATALLKTALTSDQLNDIDERAASVAGRAGAPQFGAQVAASMKETANDSARLGSWLAQVLSAAPGLLGYGNGGAKDSLSEIEALEAFGQTEIVQTARFIWSSLSIALSPQDLNTYRKIMMEMNIDLIVQYGQVFR